MNKTICQILFSIIISIMAGCSGLDMDNTCEAYPTIIAHRGYWNRNGGKENDLDSYRAAIASGILAAETDVRQTKDGILVLSHDDKYGKKMISESNFIDLDDITTLESLLNIVKQNPPFKLVIEIKNADCRDVVHLIDKVGVSYSQLVFFSFSQEYCQQLIAMQRGLDVAYLMGDLSPQELYESGYSGMAYYYKYYINGVWDIGEAKKKGLTVYAWTVNEKKVIQQLNGCDYIITDQPITLSCF